MSFGAPVRNGIGIGLRASTALSTRGGSGGGPTVSNVFSTSLYTGNGGTQTITNNINLASEGGMVWIKARSAANQGSIQSTGVSGQLTTSGIDAVRAGNISYLSSGFSLAPGGWFSTNASGTTFTSWTFREAPKFFDVVTYTGNGTTTRAIAHSLGVAPGMVIVKAISTSDYWWCWHRAFVADEAIFLNTYGSKGAFANSFPSVPTATNFTVGSGSGNANGTTYVAYLFAHDPAADGFIQCGNYTGNGSATGPTATLGWQPQWLMIKNASGVGDWQIIDSMRGMPVGAADATLQADLADAESLADYVSPTATGFQVVSTSSQVNTSGSTYIYIAIRSAA